MHSGTSQSTAEYEVHRIAINHQDDVPPQWHHKDGWPRKVISCQIDARTLIGCIIEMRPMHRDDRDIMQNLLAKWCPTLTVQTVMAILEDRYLYVDEWKPAPGGMIITFDNKTKTINVPANCHARKLT